MKLILQNNCSLHIGQIIFHLPILESVSASSSPEMQSSLSEFHGVPFALHPYISPLLCLVFPSIVHHKLSARRYPVSRGTTDGLVKRLQELEKVANMYRGMMNHTKKLLKTFFDLAQSHKGNQLMQM